ncbi:MAG: nodulation protein NfeD [Gemmatimonadales bacterium]
MRWSLFVVVALLVGPSQARAQQVSRIVVTGTIELGLAPYVRRSVREANEAGADAIILDIDTFGGRIDAAQKIVTAVIGSNVPVYALVTHNAWSAGAMIALATDSIFMTPGSSIGAATPVSGAGEKASEKVVSAMRGEFRALAERRGLDPKLAQAMVDEDIAIEGVTDSGKLLTLTNHEAVRLGVAAAEVQDMDDLLMRVGLEDATVTTVGINWAELLVRFLSNPIVAPILLSIGTLGIILEIKTPSFGIAGIVGLGALGAFFGSHLLVGLAGWEEVILLGIGLVAMLIEVLVVPGFGIAGIISIVCIGTATFLALIGALPTWPDVARASGIMLAAAMIVGVTLTVLLRHLPSSGRLRGLLLRTATDKTAGYIAEPAREDLIGAEGVALTDLRPSGTVQVGQERLDVVSETGYVAKGTSVRLIRAEGYRHVVEPVHDSLG